MNTMPSEASFWGWVIRGLGGACSLMEGYIQHGPRINEAQLVELRAVYTKLGQLVQSAETRLVERGAEYHAPIERTAAASQSAEQPATNDPGVANGGESDTSGATGDTAASADPEPGGRGY